MSRSKKYQTVFRSFLSFSLLSYIEIYIEYRETALRAYGGPLGGPKIPKKKNCDIFTLIINKLDMDFDFSKKVFF